MTVIKPNSIAGIVSVTAQGDVINFYKSDGTLAGLEIGGARINATGVSTFVDIIATGNVTIGGTITYQDVKHVDSVGIITAQQGIQVLANGLDVTGVSTFKSNVSIADYIIHTGDTDTAIRFPAADTFTVETAGSEALRVTSAGRLGIGTNNPTTPLHLFGSSDILFKVESTDAFAHIDLGDNSSIARITNDGNTGTLRLRADKDNAVSSSNIQFEIDGSEKLRIDSSGNVGIGTDNASRSLDICFDSESGIELRNYTAGKNLQFLVKDDGTGRIVSPSDKSLQFDRAGTVSLTIDSSGDVGIGTDNPESLLHIKGTTGKLIVEDTNGASSITMKNVGTNSSDDGLGSFTFTNTGYSGVSGIAARTASNGSGAILQFLSGASAEAMRLDGSGRLLAGMTSSTGAGCKVQIREDGFGRHLELLRSYDSASTPARLWFSTSRGSEASPTIQQSGDLVGEIRFNSYDGTDYNSQVATITAHVDGTPGTDDTPGRLEFNTTADGSSTPTERMRIDSSGRLLLGTSTARAVGGESNSRLHIEGSGASSNSWINLTRFANSGGAPFIQFGKSRSNTPGTYTVVQENDTLGGIAFAGADGTDLANYGAKITAEVDGTPGSNDMPGRLVFSTTADSASSPSERMRITQEGQILGGNNSGSNNLSGEGFCFSTTSLGFNGLSLSKEGTNWGTVLYIHRRFNAGDGMLIEFAHDTTTEGNISVSGSTVSYNGGHLSRWSQTVGATEAALLLKGTVMTNLDEMCEWVKEDGSLEDNEQLNKMAISSVEGDRNVAGVLVSIDDDGDLNVGMTGDMIIRIAQGVTVERGDLLMSAGDGTAKPQDDDIIRSKTIAKVTSTNVSCTYDDGSYCVPCVLMAC